MSNMKIISCGPDKEDPAPTGYESVTFPDNTEWCVYWYEAGSYDGDGTAYAKTADGKIWRRYMGHCSCFGPWDGGWNDFAESTLAEIDASLGHSTGTNSTLSQQYQDLYRVLRPLLWPEAQ